MENIEIKIYFFYGAFLIVCGIIAVTFIGLKAKTALLSGGTTGCIALGIAYTDSIDLLNNEIIGLIFPVMLLIVFSWRSTKTLFRIFELLLHPQAEPNVKDELNGKGIAFLIISLMAIVSLVVFIFQFVY